MPNQPYHAAHNDTTGSRVYLSGDSICQYWPHFATQTDSCQLLAFHHVHHSPQHSHLFPSLNHHLYADDTQLFFFFHPPDFDLNVTHLQNALQQISSWMTANLLTLNSSKTEFLPNWQKYTTPHSAPHTLLAILASFLIIWWTPFFFWPDLNPLSVLLLSHSSTLLHPSLPWLQNSLYHCHLHCPLQTWPL